MWADNEYGGYEEAHYRAGVRHGLSREFGPCPARSDNLWHVYVYNCGKITGQSILTVLNMWKPKYVIQASFGRVVLVEVTSPGSQKQMK